jgi:hypothetical protein
MPFSDIVDFLAHRKTTLPEVVFLPSPDAPAPAGADADAGQYFLIRLSEMYLSDARRWMKEVAPATFLQTEFNYAGGAVKRPFFVSNSMLPEMPEPSGPLRARFSSTSVVGPIPYSGGDVVLFLGLFQTVLKDWRAIAFDVFETVAGPSGIAPFGKYLELADKLTGKILDCLGQGDVESILADRRPLGKNMLPRSGYWAYLRSAPDGIDLARLQVVEDRLHLADGGTLRRYDASDYCLVQVECLATRNDYTAMPFHKLWLDARNLAIGGKAEEAQGLMLDCARQILLSPELTEGDKEQLIKLYQVKLHEVSGLMTGGAAREPTRAGTPDILRSMQQQAIGRSKFNADELSGVFDSLGSLARDLGKQPHAGAVDEAGIAGYLARARQKPGRAPDPGGLLRALALGSVALPGVRPG